MDLPKITAPASSMRSTASAFVHRGAEIVWCDIREDTKNIDETLVEALITNRTRAVVAVHYGGVGCEMDALLEICRRHGVKKAAKSKSMLSEEALLNQRLEAAGVQPVETDPYNSGWMIAVKLSKPEELDGLLTPQGYIQRLGKG